MVKSYGNRGDAFLLRDVTWRYSFFTSQDRPSAMKPTSKEDDGIGQNEPPARAGAVNPFAAAGRWLLDLFSVEVTFASSMPSHSALRRGSWMTETVLLCC